MIAHASYSVRVLNSWKFFFFFRCMCVFKQFALVVRDSTNAVFDSSENVRKKYSPSSKKAVEKSLTFLHHLPLFNEEINEV